MNGATPQIARNTTAPHGSRMALCSRLPAGEPPAWVELIPAGESLRGVDGREWVNDRPEAVVSAFNRPIPIDYEHATELKAPRGEEAPAAGWIEAVELRQGALWGRVEWTQRGRDSLNARDYRYLSPVFQFERQTRRVTRLVNAALTNNPNLALTALNQAGAEPEQDATMDKQLLAALGLPENASEEQALNAVKQLQADRETALNQAKSSQEKGVENPPSLDRFVPRADYDAALNRAEAAEKARAERDAAELKAAGETAVNSAIEAGKIAPASKEFYLATCASQEGLTQFHAFVKTAPKVIAEDTGLDGKTPDGASTALNAAERDVCTAMGIDTKDFLAAKGGQPQPQQQENKQ